MIAKLLESLLHILSKAKLPRAKIIPFTTNVKLPNGKIIKAEIAATRRQRATGLMGRESLLPDSGMLFVFRNASKSKFWMKKTLIPLDIIWLDSGKRVTYISKNTPPCPAMHTECPRYGPDTASLYVLEIAGGTADKLGIKEGVTLSFELPRG